ncbi:MAG: NADH-quinone oxidoreductase subunit C [Acidobacteriota bacterium]|nr:NADH-quinone oxidoreductase subunit C [Acidobacteriota bacterium]
MPRETMLPEELQAYPDAVAVTDSIVTGKYDRKELTLEIESSNIVEVCRKMKRDRQYIRLSTVTAVDRYPAEPRFEVVYHLHSHARRERLRLKCRILGTDPVIDSVTGVWRSANWYEREVFDLFGITFRNHPDLTRIMMPADWEGHPLRKDYPITGNRV